MNLDGGSRENEGGLGAHIPSKKLFSYYRPMTIFELVEAFDLALQAKLWVWKTCGNSGESSQEGYYAASSRSYVAKGFSVIQAFIARNVTYGRTFSTERKVLNGRIPHIVNPQQVK
ncbi:hypothetical protein J27TS7_24420 [Paenibacillus dendritiformis]|nr:hypothetical protein J27TS7_24420 [Paenibacillus dendritiformis]